MKYAGIVGTFKGSIIRLHRRLLCECGGLCNAEFHQRRFQKVFMLMNRLKGQRVRPALPAALIPPVRPAHRIIAAQPVLQTATALPARRPVHHQILRIVLAATSSYTSSSSGVSTTSSSSGQVATTGEHWYLVMSTGSDYDQVYHTVDSVGK